MSAGSTRALLRPLRIRNSLSKGHHVDQALDWLHSAAGRALKWYACGPTVYDAAHLGHARTYVSQDIIRRIMTDLFGLQVHLHMGVTDVDDKIISRARTSRQDMHSLARRYEQEFWEDLDELNVRRPTGIIRVTEHMDVIKDYIARIMANGLAYAAADAVYFDVGEFTHRGFQYGKLAQDADVQGADLEVAVQSAPPSSVPAEKQGGKKDPRDFALWKLAKPGEPTWASPWGAGRPGWHIECSAMTHHVLGDSFDIHSGGIDLKFPHHNNEIAQCEAFSLRDGGWVKVWLHTGHLYIKGLKMSKSLKNFITIRDYLSSHDTDDFRIFCLQNRYWANVNYSDDRIAEARNLRRQFSMFLSLYGARQGLKEISVPKRWGPAEVDLLNSLESATAAVHQALLSDFDTPEALRVLQRLVGGASAYVHGRRAQGLEPVIEATGAVADYIAHVLGCFGLRFTQEGHQRRSHATSATPEQLIDVFVKFRERIRASTLGKDAPDGAGLRDSVLQLCDSFRDKELPSLGVKLQDLPGGRTVWTQQDGAATESAPANTQEAAGDMRQWSGFRKGDVPPDKLFTLGPYEDRFSKFDARGIPTHDAQGNEISKSMRKKLEKKFNRHSEAYCASRQAKDSGNESSGSE